MAIDKIVDPTFIQVDDEAQQLAKKKGDPSAIFLGVIIAIFLGVLLAKYFLVSAGVACSDCPSSVPGYLVYKGMAPKDLRPMTLSNGASAVISSRPESIAGTCMTGPAASSPLSGSPVLSCSSVSGCVGVVYDENTQSCLLLGSCPDNNCQGMEFEAATQTNTYLKDCACLNEGDMYNEENACVSSLGYNGCPTASICGTLATVACVDGTTNNSCSFSTGTNTATPQGFQNAQFRAYGTTFGVVPTLEFQSTVKYVQDNGTMAYTMLFSYYDNCALPGTMTDGGGLVASAQSTSTSKASGGVVTVTHSNVQLTTDCVINAAIVAAGMPPLLCSNRLETPFSTASIFATGVFYPAGVVLSKGRFTRQGACGAVCDAYRICARLTSLSASQLRDTDAPSFATMYEQDKALQAFLNDDTYDDSTLFMWTPTGLFENSTTGLCMPPECSQSPREASACAAAPVACYRNYNQDKEQENVGFCYYGDDSDYTTTVPCAGFNAYQLYEKGCTVTEEMESYLIKNENASGDYFDSFESFCEANYGEECSLGEDGIASCLKPHENACGRNDACKCGDFTTFLNACASGCVLFNDSIDNKCSEGDPSPTFYGPPNGPPNETFGGTWLDVLKCPPQTFTSCCATTLTEESFEACQASSSTVSVWVLPSASTADYRCRGTLESATATPAYELTGGWPLASYGATASTYQCTKMLGFGDLLVASNVLWTGSDSGSSSSSSFYVGADDLEKVTVGASAWDGRLMLTHTETDATSGTFQFVPLDITLAVYDVTYDEMGEQVTEKSSQPIFANDEDLYVLDDVETLLNGEVVTIYSTGNSEPVLLCGTVKAIKALQDANVKTAVENSFASILEPLNEAYGDKTILESMTPCIVDVSSDGRFFGKSNRAVVPYVQMYLYGAMSDGEVYQTYSFLAAARTSGSEGTAAEQTYLCNLGSCNGTSDSATC